MPPPAQLLTDGGLCGPCSYPAIRNQLVYREALLLRPCHELLDFCVCIPRAGEDAIQHRPVLGSLCHRDLIWQQWLHTG